MIASLKLLKLPSVIVLKNENHRVPKRVDDYFGFGIHHIVGNVAHNHRVWNNNCELYQYHILLLPVHLFTVLHLNIKFRLYTSIHAAREVFISVSLIFFYHY